MAGERIGKTIFVALGVSLVCSVLVSGTVVSLERMQKENERRSRIEKVLKDLDILREGEDTGDAEKRTQRLLVDLQTGRVLSKDKYTDILNPDVFNFRQLANDPEYSREIPADKDGADIGRIPKYMVVYRIGEKEDVDKYVFHIYGKGLYSTLFGAIALGKDLMRIEGISFYEHGETPGLGGEIESVHWTKQWKGKEAFDDQGNLRIQVVQGQVDPSKPGARYKVDGISGATFTTRGVDQLVRFWLGDEGYGPFLKRLREEG